jgi:maltooligosyltrehalose trehalohydrolase
MPRRHHCLPFGAEIGPDGQTRFRLWAPDAKSVALVFADASRASRSLARDGRGWYEAVAPCGAGTLYSYRIDDELNVPDPAARFAPQGVQGPSEVVDPRAFEWRESHWEGLPWHRAVVYELHVGTFTEAGTFAAIMPRLKELAELGINTIELLPIATFPGRRGWGYDGVLPFAPHPSYGKPDDLKRLVDAAHAVGVAVVLDVVYNHFGPQGNYLHRYASGFFTERYHTPWGAAIDFESAAGRNVRDFFIENALYWLNEYHFDGLRLDAVHAIHDSSDPHFVDELAAAIDRGPGRERHVHLILENHDNEVSRLRATEKVSKAQWNDDFHHVVHVLVTEEVDGYYANYADEAVKRLGRVLAEGYAYQGEPYGERNEPRGERSGQLPPSKFVDFLQNHDQIGNRAFGERLASLTRAEQLRAAFALLLLSPHVPMLFMGEEYAALQPFLYFCEYEGELAAAITNGRRAEFAQFKAFADSKARDQIPDPNAQATFEASRLRWEERTQTAHGEWLAYVRKLLLLRAQWIAPLVPFLRQGGATFEVNSSTLRVLWPTSERGTLQLIANLSDIPAQASAHKTVRVLHSSANAAANATQLQPWEVCWALSE